MSILLRKTRTGFFMAMIGLLIMSVMAPVLTLANDDLEPGDDAVALRYSYLYSDYRDDASIEAEVAEDTPVTVEDGPLYSPIDGTPWYEVKIFEDRIGYMPGVDLEGETIETASIESTDTEATAEEPVEESAPALPWQQPIDFGVTSADVTCRGEASTGGAEIMIVASGASIEITGAEVWTEGIGWTPVNCGGVGGFIASDYIARQAEEVAAEVPVTEQAAEQTSVQETVEETTTTTQSSESQVFLESQIPGESQVSVESQIVEETTAQTGATTTDEPVTDEAAESPAPVVQPALVPIATAWAADVVNCRMAPTVTSDVIAGFEAGDAVPVTGEAFAAEGFNWTPVNCAGVGGFVATDFLIWEDPATITAAATDEIPSETAGGVSTGQSTTDEAPAEAAVERVEQEDVTDPSLAEEIIDQTNEELEGEIPTADEIIDQTHEELEGELTDVPDASESVEDVTESTVESADEVPTEEGAERSAVSGETSESIMTGGDAAPVEETTEDSNDASEEANEAAEDEAEEVIEDVEEGAGTKKEAMTETTETIEDEATGTGDEVTGETTAASENSATLDSSIAVEETESDVPVEDNAILGTAEVTGTSGLGLACRVAPESGAAVIATLPEGMGVFVLAEPDANGWMSIVCADQVGYAPAHYLYSGGDASEFTSSSPSLGTVSSTAGAGLNCRSGPSTSYSIIGYFPAGSSVNVRGAAQGDWVPVLCGGNQEGWVHGDFMSAASAPSGNTGGNDSGSSSTGVATVVNTSGDSLRCRSGAGTSYSILTNLAPGSTVNLRSGSQGDWQAVICAGQNGFAHKGFLSIGGGGGSTPDEGSGDSSTPSSGNVTVSGTGGAQLNCRTGAGTSHAAVTSVAEGTVLSVRGAAQGGWLPVVCNGQNLWVSADFVTAGGSAPSEPSTPPTSGGGTGVATGTATVVNTSGDSLRCRSGAGTSYSTITFLAAGSTVSLRSGSSGDWQAVICAGQNGFAHKGYLSTGGGSTPDPEPEPTPSGFANGDHAKVSSNLNLRYDPYMGNNVAAVAPAGTVVLITGGHAGNSYYPVNWDGLKGYMSGDYLTKTNEALSERGGSAQPTDPPTSGGGGTSTGNAIADFAMGYLGYPYVWATHGPASFDCSGFTYWVIYNVTGKNIWYGLWTQISAGVPVSRGALQPGDLVFFQNTYKAGLSHVGIYIGNNKFIHAQNESTGVVISDLDSSYYGPRWYGARRIH